MTPTPQLASRPALRRRIARCGLLGLALGLATPLAAQLPEVPEPLRPWVGWVLAEHPELPCPLLGEQRLCAWPGRLELELDDTGGRFVLEAHADRELDLRLPGDAGRWPREVTSDGASVLLRRLGDTPAVRLDAGRHRLAGRFVWSRLPESLPVPPAIGLVDLRLRGEAVRFPRREAGGLLWLAPSRGEEAEEDRLSLEVSRHVDDGVPVALTTRILLRASGRAREVDLGRPLPAGFELAWLSGGLPLRWTPDRRLVAQVRPGEWEIRLHARSLEPVLTLGFEPRPAPWPREETWVFEAEPAVRAVRVTGAPGIDPQRTSLPQEWKSLPAFLLTPGDALAFDELRRGEAQPPPDALSVARTLWLAQRGDRFTARDHLRGTLSTGGRLEALAPAELGRAALGDGPQAEQVITLGPESGRAGVEVRAAQLELEADLTYPRGGALPAVGWDRDARSLTATLNLPPGWTLVAAFGADDARGAWIERWTLLDLFLLLLTSLAVGRLFAPRWGALALGVLGIAWHEPWATGLWCWLLLLLPLLALERVLEPGRLRRLTAGLRLFAALGLLVQLAVFATDQWRTGLFPQLEAQRRAGMSGLAYLGGAARVPAPSSSELEPPKEEADEAAHPRASKLYLARRVDPNAVVQTGPGVPTWSWQSVHLGWRGPVAADQRLRLLLLSPAVELLLSLLRIAGLALLAWRLLSPRPPGEAGGRPPAAGRAPATATLGWLLALAGLALAAPARAQEAPAEPTVAETDLLGELEARLTTPPACHPHCVEIPRLSLEAGPGGLAVTAEVHAAAPTAWRLPGPAAAWMPTAVRIDGQETSALRLGDDGFLLLRLEAGVHRLELRGPARDSVTLQWPLAPRTLSFRGEGWLLDGFRPDEAPPGAVRLLRQLEAGGSSEEAPALELPPWLELERTLDVGLPWLVHYELRRLGPAGSPVLVRVPLLAGEAVTTAGVPVEDGEAVVRLEAGETRRQWRSTLEETSALSLRAPEGRPWLETWHLACSPIWHCEFAGLAPVRHMDDGRAEPRWQPWPGEEVRLSFSRPEGAPGRTTTIDAARLELSPGRRLLEGRLELEVRLSRGGEHTITLPEAAALQSFEVDGQARPVEATAGRLAFTLEPGEHRVTASWRQPHRAPVVERMPEVRLDGEAVNVSVTVTVADNRWLLWAGGPGWGPVVGFWQYLLAILLAAWALGRWAPTPLGVLDWALLGLGLTQIPLPAALLVVLAPLAYGLRDRLRPRRWWSYDVLQLALAGLGLIALGALYAAVHAGLLFRPEMQVLGPGSWRDTLHWIVERSDGALPRPWIVSLPLWVWRLLMLLWSLWLASRLLRWLPWGWRRLTLGPLLAGPKSFREAGGPQAPSATKTAAELGTDAPTREADEEAEQQPGVKGDEDEDAGDERIDDTRPI